MPRKKNALKVGAPAGRIREKPRLMQAHEPMVDYFGGRASMGSFLDIFAPSIFSQTFHHLDSGGFNFYPHLEDDLIFSDDDDDYEDCFPSGATYRPLEPHPQIKQLTDEEADRITKELVQEEERRKERTQRNKRKKMRKKEKKRLERENEVKDILHEEEETKSDSSEIQKEDPLIEDDPQVNEAAQEDKSQNSPEGDEEEEENVGKLNTKEEKKDSVLQNSPPAEDPCDQTPGQDEREEERKLPEEAKPAEDLKSDAAEKPAIQNKTQENGEVAEEKTLDPAAEELAKRSIELAMMGNRLAAVGQFEIAVKCFTDAIKHNPKEFKLFGNRSFCYERIQQYENALQDADVALSMEPDWIKGLFRKGKALCGLKRYYEASLIYKKVLSLEPTSAEASQELKRSQTLHLMEMGFNWGQSTEALKSHATLEEAVDALFITDHHAPPEEQPTVPEETTDDGEGGWTVLQSSRPRTQHAREPAESRANSYSPTHRSRNAAKPELFSVWVGILSPAMTYARLHELFSRTGTVYSIKMLLEQQCAFVNYARPGDCVRAIQYIHGMVVDGAPLTVRHPFKGQNEPGATQSASTEPYARPSAHKKECFFWRTTGCTRSDCTFQHVPQHKNMDREKFTSRLGCFGNHK